MPDEAETSAESRARLETEVEAFKTRNAEQDALAGEREAARRERRDGSMTGMENVTQIGALMPEIISVFHRLARKSEEFRAEMRLPFADLRARPCRLHPLTLREPAFEETCQRSRDAGTFTPSYAPCPDCTDGRTRDAYRDFWRRRGVEERNIDSTLDNFFPLGATPKKEALERVCAWQARNGLFLLLCGSPGTGKGHLATGCLKAHGSGLFVKHADMLRQLRDGYTTHTVTPLIESWQTAGLLVVDEFGVSGGGKDDEPMIYQVVSDRYDKGRPTVITSNLLLGELRAALGERLADRVRADCEAVTMVWESYRSAKP